MRRMPATSSSTRISSTTALAAAPGYCSSDIWFFIISATEALCPPLITCTVEKSAMTSVTTKIVPIAMPGLASGRMTVQRIWKALAPASRAASISERSMRISVLKIGVTMNSV
jgi:hypothetical protein